ncbi:MAG: hypothetical protein FWD38_07925 [Oscillospiraceae bacterium]|nr:hypothetical protein [Oscillospiraceae bacterium]
MTGREAFEIWAQPDSKWSSWVRPVAFIMPECGGECREESNHTIGIDIPDILYIDEFAADTAIFVDRCGYSGINEGLALAGLGWCPVPLYNGTNEQSGAMALVDNHGIENALIWGAGVLNTLSLKDDAPSLKKDAPPAFLLDSNRRHRYKPDVSVYDNSWDLYNQDIPSPEYFTANGIDKIIISGEKIHKDLRVIFHDFQKKGIRFFFTDGYGKPEEVRIRKPLWWMK